MGTKVNITENSVTFVSNDNIVTVVDNNSSTSTNITGTDITTVTVSAPGPKGDKGQNGNLFDIPAGNIIQPFTNITASGNIKATSYISASEFRTTGNITASGHISASGTGSFSYINVGQYIKHIDDPNTYLNFTEDRLRFNIGGISYLDLNDASTAPHDIIFNNGNNNVDLTIKGSSSTILFTDASTHRVGIGTDTPGETLEVVGNISASGAVTASGLFLRGNATVVGDVFVTEYIKHKGDTNTAVRFTDNKISLDAGGMTFFAVHDDNSAPFNATVNGGSNKINFRALDENQDVLLRTDSEAHNVALYYAGNKKLETTSSGVNITGNITASGAISASGIIDGGIFRSFGKGLGLYSSIGNTLALSSTDVKTTINGTEITIGDATHNKIINLKKSVTASSHISSSGTGSFTGGVLAGSHIIPTLSGSYDLGSSTKPWRELYVLSSSINFVGGDGTTEKFTKGDIENLREGKPIVSEANKVSIAAAGNVPGASNLRNIVRASAIVHPNFEAQAIQMANQNEFGIILPRADVLYADFRNINFYELLIGDKGKKTNLHFTGRTINLNGPVTASNHFRINNDLTVTGKITAEEFHTEFVSSSILFKSGSTLFGNSTDDVHEFVGDISGSSTTDLTLGGNITASGTMKFGTAGGKQIHTFFGKVKVDGSEVVIGEGHISASGNISSSGTVRALTGSFGSGTTHIHDNIQTAAITATGNVAAGGLSTANFVSNGKQLILGAVDNPRQELIVFGKIQQKGSDLTIMSGSITASGNISSSGTMRALTGSFGTGTTHIHDSIQTAAITATSTITSAAGISGTTINGTKGIFSDNMVVANRIQTNLELRAPGFTASNKLLQLGSDTPLGRGQELIVHGKLQIKGSDITLESGSISASSHIFTAGNITASGDVSASGNVFAGQGATGSFDHIITLDDTIEFRSKDNRNEIKGYAKFDPVEGLIAHSASYADNNRGADVSPNAITPMPKIANLLKKSNGTAHTIGGVPFANTVANQSINLPGVNIAGNQDTSGRAATATLAAQATILENARTIGGVSFDGSANINLPGVNANQTNKSFTWAGNAATATTASNAVTASSITTVNNSIEDSSHYVTFVDGITGAQVIETDKNLIYNPRTNLLTTTARSAQTASIALSHKGLNTRYYITPSEWVGFVQHDANGGSALVTAGRTATVTFTMPHPSAIYKHSLYVGGRFGTVELYVHSLGGLQVPQRIASGSMQTELKILSQQVTKKWDASTQYLAIKVTASDDRNAIISGTYVTFETP